MDIDYSRFYWKRPEPEAPPAPPSPEVNPEPETKREVKLLLNDPRPVRKLRPTQVIHTFTYSVNDGPPIKRVFKLPTTLRGRDAEKYLQEFQSSAHLISVTHDFA